MEDDGCFVKRDQHGEIDKFKVRYVAKGYGQVFGSDYCETFAPTAKLTTIRVCLAVAAQLGHQVFQIDVKSAYLNAEITETIFLEQPEGFVQTGKNGETLYCHLIKSLYGLKQAGRRWNELLDSWIVGYGLMRSNIDHCLYTMEKEGARLFVVIWVDDILYFGETKLVSAFKVAFSENFRVDDRGLMRWFLGMEVVQANGKIQVNQKKYVFEILKRFQMTDCNPINTPADSSSKLSKSSCPEPDTEEAKSMTEYHSLYRSLVGNLLYLAVVSRPDISFIVSTLSQFLNNPGKVHWVAAKRVLRYLKGTASLGLIYGKCEVFTIQGFSDSDWGTDSDDRRSISGYCFAFSHNTGVVSWNSKKQATVALSSSEAEYLAMSSAAQELLFLRALSRDVAFATVDRILSPSRELYRRGVGLLRSSDPSCDTRFRGDEVCHISCTDVDKQGSS